MTIQHSLAQPKPSIAVTLTRSMHAVLYRAYSMAERTFVSVGTQHGDYGPEDDTGAEFRCLGQPAPKPGFALHSRDYKTGHFYPENVFVTGHHDDENRSLSHQELIQFVVQSRLGNERSVRRVLLPRGCGRDGHPVFEPALMFSPIEAAPYWGAGGASVERSLKTRFPEIMVENLGHAIVVHGERMSENRDTVDAALEGTLKEACL